MIATAEHTVTVPKRRVTRQGDKSEYKYVVEYMEPDGTWTPYAKEFWHSTSAYAALGRMVAEASTK